MDTYCWWYSWLVSRVIISRDVPGGVIGNIIAGIVGGWLGSMLMGDFGPEIGGFFIIPTLIGAIIVIGIISFIMGSMRK